jgi:hypothetical protein
VVVFQHPKLGRLIKLVERLEEEGSLVMWLDWTPEQ